MIDLPYKTACFTGHRPQSITYLWDEDSVQSLNLRKRIRSAVIYLIETYDVRHFISGMAIGVDMIAAEVILEVKNQYSDITLECAIPCEVQPLKWSDKYKSRYYRILELADTKTVMQTSYTADCMHKRNCYMVDKSDFVIAVWNGSPSGTGKTVLYAKERNKRIIKINP